MAGTRNIQESGSSVDLPVAIADGGTGATSAADARTALGVPAVAHTHAEADVTGLTAALAAKAASSHGHGIADTTGLQAAIDAKAASSHTHAVSDTTGLQAALDGKAAASHAHSAADLTSGTIPDGRFPATLPAASGANLTALNATQLATGTIPDARFPAVLPAVSGANLTNLPSSGAPTKVRKSSDQTIVGGNALVADTALTFAVGANETWVADLALFINASGSPVIAFSFPAGATFIAGGAVISPTDAYGLGHITASDTGATANLNGATLVGRLNLCIVNGANAGNVTLKYHAGFSNITMKAGSFLVAHKF